MTDIVINRCPQGTLLNETGLMEYVRRKFGGSTVPEGFTLDSIKRDDPVLLGMFATTEDREKFKGDCSHIRIVKVADGFPWKVKRKGTFEWVAADA